MIMDIVLVRNLRFMNVYGEVCSVLPPVLSIVLNTPVMKVPNTSYFNIINLGIININYEIKIKFIQEVNK